MTRLTTLALALLVACAKQPTPTADASDSATGPTSFRADPLVAAVNHPDRPEEDRARDTDRQALETLRFLGLAPGMTVVDLMGGRGWSTELIARAVGPEGRVYAQNNRFVLDRFAEGPLSERLARPGLEHVVRLDQELDALDVPAGSVDVVFMGLFYHDSYWMPVDRAAMNDAVFRMLAPGGVFVVSDHLAAPGHGVADVKTLHRVEEQPVLDEILAAGFTLDARSDVLRHPEDDRTLNVFDDAIRGKTDRFLLRVRKPAPSGDGE